MTYTITRCRSYFTRCGYEVRIFDDDGTPHTRLVPVEGQRTLFPDKEPLYFYGNDGRTVRAEAIAFVKKDHDTMTPHANATIASIGNDNTKPTTPHCLDWYAMTPEQAYLMGTKGRGTTQAIRRSPCLLACYRAGLEEGGWDHA